MNNNFYMPKYKSEFVNYLAKHRKWKKWKLRKLSINQLCKIYCDVRRGVFVLLSEIPDTSSNLDT